MGNEIAARILQHPAVTEFTIEQLRSTVPEQQAEIRRLETALFLAQRKSERLPIEESLRVRVDAAITAWLFERQDFLVFDDGDEMLYLASYFRDHHQTARFAKFDALLRSLIRQGKDPSSILRGKCSRVYAACGCGDAECRNEKATALEVPPAIERLMAEVRRGCKGATS